MHEKKNWMSDDFIVTTATSLDNPQPMNINVSETLGHNKRPRTTNGPAEVTQRFYLLPAFNDNSAKFRKETLYPFLCNAALDAQFTIIIRENSAKKMKLICNRGRYYEERDEESSKKTTTTRPIKGSDGRCPFSFSIYFDHTNQRWYFPHQQAGNKCHVGHFPVPRAVANPGAAAMTQEEQALDADCVQAHVPTGARKKLIMKRSNVYMTKTQLRHMREKQRELLIDSRLSLMPEGAITRPTTAADRLLAQYDENDSSCYIALYAEFDSDLLTIKKKCKFRAKHTLEDVSDDAVRVGLSDARLDAKKIRMAIRNSLKVSRTSDGGKEQILLAFAWTDEMSRKRFDMFPEVVAADCVNFTNKEERPLLQFSGIDSRNKTFTSTWVFMPSEASWAFNWVFRSAIPYLHKRSTLGRVRMVITDQDGSMNQVIDSSIGPGQTFPRAKPRLCIWHKLDRNLTAHTQFKSLIKNSTNEDSDNAEWNALVTWLWDMSTSPETEWEANLMFVLLDLYLKEDPNRHKGKIDPILKNKLVEFVAKRFQNVEHKLLAHHFKHTRCFDRVSSSIVEAENSALKNHCMAPTPQTGIDTSHSLISDRTRVRNIDRAFTANDAMLRVPTSEPERDATVTDVTQYNNDGLYEQFLQRQNYCCHRVSPSECWVRRKPSPPVDFSQDRRGQLYELRRKLRQQYLIPKFERTRVVQLRVDPHSGDTVAVCSCGFFDRWGYCCRHIYAALQHCPNKLDSQVRWWNAFDYMFTGSTVSEEIRDKVMSLHALSDAATGVVTPVKEFPLPKDEGFGEGYFREALELPVLTPRGYWGTPPGMELVERARNRVSSYRGGIIPFGLEESVQTGVQETHLDYLYTSPVPSPAKSPAPGPRTPSQMEVEKIYENPREEIDKHIDDLLVSQVLDENNCYGILQETMNEIQKLANNKKRREMAFRGLHYLHQSLLENAQESHKGTVGEGGMESVSNASSGTRTSNRRLKRKADKIRDEIRKKAK